LRLAGKKIIITGAGSGIGAVAAQLFAQEGAAILVSDVVPSRATTVAEAILAGGGNAIAVAADVTKESDIDLLIDAAVGELGGLDVMWANAGIPEPNFGATSFEDSETSVWGRVLDVNLNGVYYCFRAATRQFLRQGSTGNLLATSSAAAFVAYPGFPIYTVSKAAVNGLVRAAAVELGKYGIRANALCPVHGGSANFALPSNAPVVQQTWAEVGGAWDKALAPMPLRLERPPSLSDHANLALYLASDESAYVSGQCIESASGGTFARPAIMMPSDRGESANQTVLPTDVIEKIASDQAEALRTQSAPKDQRA